jgi:uncharacterized membrane protein (DUF106 family)
MIEECGKVLNFLFQPLLLFNPLLSLLLLSLISTILIMLYQRKVFKRVEVKKIKENIDELKEKMIKIQKSGNKEEMEKILDEILKNNFKLMKENFKVIILSFFLGIVILSWVSFAYSGYYIKLPFPVFTKISSIYFYIILSFVIGIVLAKIFEIG